MLLGHLGLYASQRVAAQQLPGVLQVPRTEELHEPRETARRLVAVGRTELSTYGPLLRALVRLRPNLTPSGAEVDVDGFDGERVFVRVADCPYAGRSGLTGLEELLGRNSKGHPCFGGVVSSLQPNMGCSR